MKVSINCPYCAAPTSHFMTAIDLYRKTTKESFEYNICEKCNLIFMGEIPANLSEYYNSTYHKSLSKNELYVEAGKHRHKIKKISKLIEGNKYLEIGPSFGAMALAAKEEGFVVDAIEMDEVCCERLSNDICDNVYHNDKPLEVIHKLNSYDVIVMSQVIEHLPDAIEVLNVIASKLNNNGVLLISAPNPMSTQFKIMKEKWPHLDAPRHVFLMPIDLLKTYLKSKSCEVVYISTNDRDSMSCSYYGWKKYFDELLPSTKICKKCIVLLSFIAFGLQFLLDAIRNSGTTYTLIFQKK